MVNEAEAEETLVSTEIYEDPGPETAAGRIVWSPPSRKNATLVTSATTTTTTTTTPTRKNDLMKETVAATVEVEPTVKRVSGQERTRITTTTADAPEIITTGKLNLE